MKMTFKSNYVRESRTHVGYTTKGKSKTVQGQALTIKSILEKFAHGNEIPVGEPNYLDPKDPAFITEAFSMGNMDLTDIHTLSELKADLIDRIDERKKQIEAFEAEKKAMEMEEEDEEEPKPKADGKAKTTGTPGKEA